jgi:hypothetical protein
VVFAIHDVGSAWNNFALGVVPQQLAEGSFALSEDNNVNQPLVVSEDDLGIPARVRSPHDDNGVGASAPNRACRCQGGLIAGSRGCDANEKARWSCWFYGAIYLSFRLSWRCRAQIQNGNARVWASGNNVIGQVDEAGGEALQEARLRWHDQNQFVRFSHCLLTSYRTTLA